MVYINYALRCLNYPQGNKRKQINMLGNYNFYLKAVKNLHTSLHGFIDLHVRYLLCKK